MDTAQGWPFLVARGRARGYSVLLAPDFLVARRDYGFLEEVAGPLPDGTPFRTTTIRRDHGDLGVVWSDYPTNVRDEHSRPLRLLAGFACTGTISRPSELDLEAARAAAVATFERFLLDEDGFTVESAAPFPAHSAVTRSTAGASPPRRLTVPAVVLCAAVAVALLVLLLTSRRGGTPPPRTVQPCATTQVAVGQATCVSATTVTIRKGHVTP
ncbi:MAG TPA: hypothetical protein VHV49_15980 [Pseudonocardiaceae bacterium]|jgi:hypothetical protein|nr:hypothetical protein [Pseudonocardiaceae bacterium]